MDVTCAGYRYCDCGLHVNSNDGCLSDCSDDGTNKLEARLWRQPMWNDVMSWSVSLPKANLCKSYILASMVHLRRNILTWCLVPLVSVEALLISCGCICSWLGGLSLASQKSETCWLRVIHRPFCFQFSSSPSLMKRHSSSWRTFVDRLLKYPPEDQIYR